MNVVGQVTWIFSVDILCGYIMCVQIPKDAVGFSADIFFSVCILNASETMSLWFAVVFFQKDTLSLYTLRV